MTKGTRDSKSVPEVDEYEDCQQETEQRYCVADLSEDNNDDDDDYDDEEGDDIDGDSGDDVVGDGGYHH